MSWRVHDAARTVGMASSRAIRFLHNATSGGGTGAAAASGSGSGLAAADALGTASAMRPEALHLSPLVGLMFSCGDDMLRNMLQLGGGGGSGGRDLGTACELARELFSCAGDRDDGIVAPPPPRPTTNLSLPAPHLSASDLGHIVGLAVSRAGEGDVRAALARAGIASNRVRGAWTGVSRARFVRLVRLLRDAHEGSPSTPALHVLLRFLWARARGKADLLHYMAALNEHVPVVDGALLTGDGRSAYLAARFAPHEISDGAAAAAAFKSVSLLKRAPGPAGA